MDTKKAGKELMLILIIFLPVLIGLIVKDQLPAGINISWIRQEGFKTWTILSVLFAFTVFVYLLILIVPGIDPEKENIIKLKSRFYLIRFAVSLLMSIVLGIYMVMLTGLEFNAFKAIRICIFLFLAVYGNYIFSMKQNMSFGFRNPWTMKSETVWRRTNQFGSRIMVLLSIVGIVFTLIPGRDRNELIEFFMIIVAIVLLPTLYSILLYKKYDKN